MRESAFVFLLHAHDRAWRNGLPLRERIEACDLLWKLAIKMTATAEVCK